MSTTACTINNTITSTILSDDKFSNSDKQIKLVFKVNRKDSVATGVQIVFHIGNKAVKTSLALSQSVGSAKDYTITNFDISSIVNTTNNQASVDLEINFVDSSDLIIGNYTFSKSGILIFAATPNPPTLASNRASSSIIDHTLNDDITLSLNYYNQGNMPSGLKLSTLSFHYEVYDFKNSLYKTVNISIGNKYADTDNGKVRSIVITESQVTSFSFSVKPSFAKRKPSTFKVEAWVSYVGRNGGVKSSSKKQFLLNTSDKPAFKNKKERMHIIDKYADRNDSFDKSVEQAPFSVLRKSSRLRNSGVAYKVTR